MHLSDLTRLARDLESSDPHDRLAQQRILERFRELRALLRRDHPQMMADCMGVVSPVLEVIAGSRKSIGRAELRDIACGVLTALGHGLGSEPFAEEGPFAALPPEEDEIPLDDSPFEEAPALAIPEAASRSTSEVSSEAISEATPEETSEATPKAQPKATHAATPKAPPKATPVATPKAVPKAKPDASPEASLEPPPLPVSQSRSDSPPKSPAPARTKPRPSGAKPPAPAKAKKKETNMPLGRMLVELGHVTRAQLADALRYQREKGPRIGECLLLQGVIEPQHLLNVLEIQDLLRSTPQGITPETLARYRKVPQGMGFEAAAEAEAERIAAMTGPPTEAMRITEDIFLGEVLLGAEMITNAQLEAALHVHRTEGVRFGDALLKLGVLDEEDLEAGIQLQTQLRNIASLRVR